MVVQIQYRLGVFGEYGSELYILLVIALTYLYGRVFGWRTSQGKWRLKRRIM